MRLQLAAIVIVGWPAVIAAQTRVPVPGAAVTLPSLALPLSPIDLPLSQIGRSSVSTIGLPPATDMRTRGGGHLRRPVEGQHRRAAVYFIPAYGWLDPNPERAPSPTPAFPDETAESRETKPPTGGVRLEVQPERNLQLFVDGYYVGTLEDLGGELQLEAGPHRIEMRAPGYETSEVAVRIPFGGSITYRGALTPANKQPLPDPPVIVPTAAAPPVPRTFYLIPGCYVGNVSPKDVNLPATCDLGRLTTVTKESGEP